MSRREMIAIGILTTMLGLLGCNKPTAAVEVLKPKAAAPAGQGESVVTRIVFIDKQECCACTQRAIDASWAALQEVLGKDSKLPIERVHLDTQAAKAGVYRAKRALVTAPAIYFLDAADEVVELLQGEVTAAEIRKAMNAAG